MPSDIIIIFLGALAGGFVNGLTGFGTGLTAMPFWLFVLPPAIAAQLAAAAGVIGQLQTLPTIWRRIRWRHVLPFIVPGLVGVPLGTWLLPLIPQSTFKLSIGAVIVAYSCVMLAADGRLRLTLGGRIADMSIGLGGGVLAGLAGLSGVMPTIWATLKGYSKDEKRALFQTFNFTILSAMLVSSAAAGLMTRDFGLALAISLPGTIVGARTGAWVYARLDERRFDRLVLMLLLVAGLTLIATQFWRSQS